MFGHGPDVVASMLGVLKAGKFYVILDASYPRERLQQLLTDSGAALIVTTGEDLALARDLAAAETSVLDLADRGDEPDEDIAEISSSPDDLAVIIYTSGSTGRPKGVMHTHRTVLADIANVTNELQITAQDRWLWQTSVSFGGSVRTIFGALLNGSAIYPFDSKRHGFATLPRVAAAPRDHDLPHGADGVSKLHGDPSRRCGVSGGPDSVDGRRAAVSTRRRDVQPPLPAALRARPSVRTDRDDAGVLDRAATRRTDCRGQGPDRLHASGQGRAAPRRVETTCRRRTDRRDRGEEPRSLARLLARSGADRRGVHRRRARRQRAHVFDWRPGHARERRPVDAPWPPRFSGEDSRLSDRGGGDRDRAPGDRRRRRRSRSWTARPFRRHAALRLLRADDEAGRGGGAAARNARATAS